MFCSVPSDAVIVVLTPRSPPQGSVEAQCGLVLNGQGGVIRRGRGSEARSIVLPRATSTHTAAADKTRQRTDRNTHTTPLSPVNTCRGNTPFLYPRAHTRPLTHTHTHTHTHTMHAHNNTHAQTHARTYTRSQQ